MHARALALAALLLAPLALAQPAEGDAATRALAALATRRDGAGFAGVDAAYVAQAASSAGLDAGAWPPGAPALDGLRIDLAMTDAAYKSALQAAYAVATAGHDPHTWRGIDLVAHVRKGWGGAEFGEVEYVNDDVWAILALRAAGVPADDEMVRRAAAVVLGARAPDGGWGWTTVAPTSNTDLTGMALVALRSAGVDLVGDARAAAYFASVRETNGAYRDYRGGGGTANLQSTLWALQGLHAIGGSDPAAEAYVRARQLPDGLFETGRAHDAGKGNAWASAEAALWLAGGRHPLRGWSPPTLETSLRAPGEASRIEVRAPFDHARWTIGNATLEGRAVDIVFPRWGPQPFELHATGPGLHARLRGTFDVPSVPPVARLAAPVLVVDRHALARPDLTPSTDADGRVVSARVDWGDGTQDEGPLAALGHAYALPGNHTATARVRDDAGTWSEPIGFRVEVRDRAPSLALPPRILTDRVTTLAVPVAVSDPDGDAVALTWRIGETSGEGLPRLRIDRLGEHTLHVEASDPYGLSTHATTTITVVNLPPDILAAQARPLGHDEVELFAAVSDTDGPAPSLSWSVDGVPTATTRVRLAPGAHTATVHATDADGATATRRVAFVLGEGPIAPRLHHADVRLEGGALVVEFEATPPEAEVTIAWTTAEGSGEARARASPLRIALPDATHAHVRVTAKTADGEADLERTVLARGAPTRAPPLVLEASTGHAWTGAPVTLRAVASGATTYRFDLGDGHTTAWASDALVRHVYERPGLYAVVAQARSATGAVANAHGAILIEEAPQAPPTIPPPAPPTPRVPTTPPASASWTGSSDPLTTVATAEVPGAHVALLLMAIALLATRGRPRSRA